ncbi:MAG: hypothetical protein QM610_00315 [Chitinophagaceae bacterium]
MKQAATENKQLKKSKGERLNWTPLSEVKPIVLHDHIGKTVLVKDAFTKVGNNPKRTINVIIP